MLKGLFKKQKKDNEEVQVVDWCDKCKKEIPIKDIRKIMTYDADDLESGYHYELRCPECAKKFNKLVVNVEDIAGNVLESYTLRRMTKKE